MIGVLSFVLVAVGIPFSDQNQEASRVWDFIELSIRSHY